MKTLTWLPCALAVVALAVLTPVANAADADGANPAKVAAACIAKARLTADHCIAHNHVTADRTVATINVLLGQGKVKAARAAAKAGIEVIVRRSGAHLQEIGTSCRRCAAWLETHGAPQLARRVMATCEAQQERIRDSRNRTARRIRAALPSNSVD